MSPVDRLLVGALTVGVLHAQQWLAWVHLRAIDRPSAIPTSALIPLLFGVWQLLYVVPVVGAAWACSAPRFASGAVAMAVLTGIANVLVWRSL